MHGPGERDNDADIKDLLLRDEPQKIVNGIREVNDRHQKRFARYLASRFPGLSSQERADVWEGALDALMDQIRARRFKAKGSLTGLLQRIIYCDASDRLRRKKLWRRFVDLAAPATFEILRFDDLHDLEDLLAAIKKHMDTALEYRERLVLRTYVLLVREGHATMTGRLPMVLLTTTVNESIHPPLSQAKVESLLGSARETLRTLLDGEGFFQ
jgi:DNA-directed RNA polymerase specialized sigma24 family protein